MLLTIEIMKERDQQVFNAIKGCPTDDLTQRDLSEQLDISVRTLRRSLRRLEKLNMIETRNLGNKGNVYKVLNDTC